MNSRTKKTLIAVGVVFLILLIDQLSKIWVKTNMALFDNIYVFGDWFQIRFVENDGMIFGIEAGNKLLLTLFRIFIVCCFTFFIVRLIRQDYKIGFIVCASLVLAGGVGNVIDNVFYGLIFEASTPTHVASFVPWGQGYASLFHGSVVDMLYFPIIQSTYPQWVPFFGGQDFLFFRYIFNVADSAVFSGVVLLLIFYRHTFFYSLMSKKEREKFDKEKQEQQNA